MDQPSAHRLRFAALAAALLFRPLASAHGPASGADPDEHRLIEFPDTAEHLTLVVDLHTHTVFSDGHVWPTIRVGEALRDGLDAMAVTEHLEYQPHLEDIPHPDRNRSFEEAVASLPEGSELIIVPGSEITRGTPIGHMNAVFISDANALLRVGPPAEPFDVRDYFARAGEWPAQDAVDEANRQGAFVFWNHSWSVFDDAKSVLTDFHRQNVERGKLHGIEIANGRTYSAESFQIALDHDLAVIGVSDVHNLIDWDYEPHAGGHRPVNLVFAKEKSAASIRQALFERRTVVWYRNLLLGRARELEPLLTACVEVVSASYRPHSRVLELTLRNVSDASLELRSTSGFTLVRSTDLVELPAHEETTLYLRTGEVLERVKLDFEVLNALTAPGAHATLAIETAID